ncbi:putative cytochrome B5 [Aspergillus germanicus]
MSTYTLEQVKAHCKPDDVWIILHNKVYDVTKYLEDHPGGAAVLIEVAGTDATQAFEDIGHSDEAREQLEPYYLGDLPDTEHADSVDIYRPTFEQVAQSAVISVKKPSALSSSLLAVLKLGLGGVAGAAAISAYWQGWTLPHLPSISFLSSLGFTNISSSSHQFWSGVGIASVAQFSLTLSLGVWASTKLDVQQEFTHYKPHRPASTARLIRLKRSKSATVTQTPVLNPRQWRPFTLTSKVEVAPNVYQLTFSLPSATDILNLPTGQHVALRALINGTQVTRSYTPISNTKDIGHIQLLIKTYSNGAMTQHLARMTPGDTIEMRGPKGAMTYSSQYAQTIGMIAGGTGITPMYQVIRAICEDESDATRVSLLYANNTEEDILMREELEGLAKKFPQKLEVRYVLSRAGDDWKGYRGFVSGELIEKHIGGPDDTKKVLLCGPPPMVNAMKKILGGMGWAMPGAVAKAADSVFCF